MPETKVVPPDLDIKLPMSAKTADRLAWTAWIMMVLGTIAGALAAMALVPEGFYQRLAAGAGTIFLLVAQLIQRKLPTAKALANLKNGAAAILVLGALALAGCPAGQSAAWKATGGTMNAFKSASKALAAGESVKHAECLKLHGAGAAAYATCIGDTRRRLITYRDTIRPAGRSSVAAAYATIRTVEEAKKGDVDYIAILKPGACALIVGLREWGHKLPDKAASIMPWLSVFAGAVCDKVKNAPPKSAAAIITALLPVAVELVRWVISLVGADESELQKEINAWILGPAADEVDELLTKITAALPGGGK